MDGNQIECVLIGRTFAGIQIPVKMEDFHRIRFHEPVTKQKLYRN